MEPIKRPRVFYGWVILGSLIVVTLAGSAMTGPHRALYITPMTDELGIALGAFGLAQSAQMVVGNLTAPFRGWLIDRIGARIPLVAAGLITGVLVMSLSLVTEAWHLIVIFGLTGVVGLQAGQLYTTVPLAKWFVRLRARVLSLVFLGIPIGVMLWSPTTQWLIDSVGWRSTWVLMAGSGGLTIAVVGLFLVRRQPEDMGLRPDGDLLEELDSPATIGETDTNYEYPWTRREVMKTRAFWKISIAFGLEAFAVGTLVMFRIPHFIDSGIDSQLVAWGLSMEGFSAILVATALGFILGRIHPRIAGVTGFSVMLIAVLLTMFATEVWEMFVAFFVFGLAIAMIVIVQNVLWPSYFGRAHIGAIRGVVMLVMLPFAGLGAPIAGFVHDSTGSYLPVWSAAAVALVVGALLLVSTSPPRPTPQLRE